MLKNRKLEKLTLWHYLKLTFCEYLIKALNYVLKSDINWCISVNVKKFEYPIYLRCGTSDYPCFHVIFIQEDYLDIVRNISQDLDLMIDCGTNVGFTARYFLAMFPKLKLICLEPDVSNFAIATKNLHHYKERTVMLQKAVWSKPCRTEVIAGDYGNGGKWALQVRETGNKNGVLATDLNIILDNRTESLVFIKMDIEGAEKEVLSRNTDWAQKCRFLAVEVHDDEALNIFKNFIKSHNMNNLGLFGEMYLLKNNING